MRRGLVSKLTVCCTSTACTNNAAVSDPYVSDAKCLNARSVLGMREIGKGRNSLETFCGMMDMLPPVSIPAFSDHNRHLSEISMESARENILAASAHLHQFHGVPPDQNIDVVVTCDGTWLKRGFTATYGVVAVITWDTGQVLDFEIKSKRCRACSLQLKTVEKTSDEFIDWWDTHKGVCEANHEDSSPAMEPAAALDIWKRSEEHLHLRFTEVISDGDSKTVAMLQESSPYGKNVAITKYECVGHVQKRVGKHLREAKRKITAQNKVARQRLKELQEKEKEKKKMEEKLKGKRKGKRTGVGKGKAIEEKKDDEIKVIKGVLSDKTIDLLQTYYGNALRSHVGDLEGMKRACWAVFYHSISTDDNPQHNYCSEGADSWCKYQCATVLQQDVPSHTPRIPEGFEPFIRPVFEHVCNEELLEKCLKGATQNQNERFNNLMWARSPKSEYSSLATTQIAVSHATIVFNSGVKALVSVMKGLGIDAGRLCLPTCLLVIAIM